MTANTTTVRTSSFATSVILIVQFALGMGVNLYVTVPTHKAFFSTVFGQGALAAHAIVGVVLLAAGVSTLIRSIRARRGLPWAILGLVAILVAAGAGSGFVNSGSAAASMAMALATAVAMLAYLIPVFTLSGR
jgi:hypothetical protein